MTAILATAATAAWHLHVDVTLLMMDRTCWTGQIWRLFTSALLHVDLMHIVYNLYWLWVFGSLVEESFGSRSTAGIYLLFAAGSQAAEYAIFQGGVGLSGIVYGLFGMLWVLSRRDERFRDSIDANTITMFIAWFFLCIALTASGSWAVANVAHGMGAALGALLGFAISSVNWRLSFIVSLAGLSVLTIAAATFLRPLVNFPKFDDLNYEGYVALNEKRYDDAAGTLLKAVEIKPKHAGAWINLGNAYARLNRLEEAMVAYERAADLADASLHDDVTANMTWIGWQYIQLGDRERAIGALIKSLGLSPGQQNAKEYLDVARKMPRRE